jgi:glycosyltransferase involved in cell wall biosynthesis
VGIRLLVVDDNPHVRWRGAVYPVNATFHRFLAAFLDLPGSPVASIAHAVPLRELRDSAPSPSTLPVDPRIRTVPTAPFDGIGGFLHHALSIVRANRPIFVRELRRADRVWIKVPASNAAVAAAIAVRFRVPRFVWVAGSSLAVVRGQQRGLPAGIAARVVAAAYDGIGRFASIGGRRLVIGEGVVGGGGIVTSLVDPGEDRMLGDVWPREHDRLRIVWAGRLASGKGLEILLQALPISTPEVYLSVLGDGPDRARLRALAGSLGVEDRVRWCGYVADRALYLDELAAADMFVLPSPAEGFPKVVLDALALGVPVVATRAGALAELAAADLVEAIDRPDSLTVAHALHRLWVAGDATARERASRGHTFATQHTRPAEAARLLERWWTWWPHLANER